ncbi:magnesium transporter CorA family protein [Lysobacter humi (ex Lee et al. 2017)]
MTTGSTRDAPDATPSSELRIRVMLFERDRAAREVEPDTLARHAQPSEQQLLWVDVVAPDGPPDGLSVLGVELPALEPESGADAGLLVADRWKFLYVRALNWHEGERPTGIPVTVALGDNIVITQRRGPAEFIDTVLDNARDHLRVGHLESAVFAMALLDRMLTDYLDARDAFENALDRLELTILRRPRSAHLAELQRMRHLASRLRRQLAAQRDVFEALGRPDFDPGQSRDAERACRLISRRYTAAMGAMEAARELVAGSFELYTSRAAESTSQAMHTLTVVTVAMGLAATIAAVLGMNFNVPIFETGTRGFVVALAVIGAVIAGSTGWAVLRLLRSGRQPTSSS